MGATTNSLVANTKLFIGSAVLTAAIVAFGTLAFHHTVAHAAAIVPGAPMDEKSVSSLEELDNAVEAVAARVTPAVVNVSVTSRPHAEEGAAEDGAQSGGNFQGG